MSLYVEQNYLHRLTPLFGIAVLAPVVNIDTIKRMFLPVLVSLSTDKIPNIKMNVCKSI